ncbi:helix-turn-helix domain-containing protein [Pseudomonas sp. KNUC1026]|uniref:helix-turn-helix domain-containing protein n=1 Tax=Pseudomonas sp. KNUC1026 TaxID=2893890 RepID=UPI001F3603B4|nr:helix-turn-helix transcriptional regulator [Pseudomonas sp. KNUC1026]UFH49590.1 helix-turn-helix domain-containing protein [Pseudomonas sp. KNUC1026]
MLLRQALAEALLLLRTRKGVTQRMLAVELDASQVSRLERAQSAATLESIDLLAQALEIQPLTLLTLAYAIKAGSTPHDALKLVSEELGLQDFLDIQVSTLVPDFVHPLTARGIETTHAVLELKGQGLSQAQVARSLGISTSTVGRHWNRSAG